MKYIFSLRELFLGKVKLTRLAFEVIDKPESKSLVPSPSTKPKGKEEFRLWASH